MKTIEIQSGDFKNMPIVELKKAVDFFYRNNLQGQKVVNKALNISIVFSKVGRNKVVYGGNMYYKKALVIFVLKVVLENASYSNWGNRKETDPAYVIGYLNFKAKISIDNKSELIRLAIQMRKDGKFYYSHEVNRKK